MKVPSKYLQMTNRIIVSLPIPLLTYYLVASYVYRGWYLKDNKADQNIDRTLSWLIVELLYRSCAKD